MFINFAFGMGAERRSSLESPTVPISSSTISEFLGLGGKSAAGVSVTTTAALGVPAVWTAVNFLAGTLAGLPLQLYSRERGTNNKVHNTLADILARSANEGCSSFQWRKYLFEQVFTSGRALSFIERDARKLVTNIWPLEPGRVTLQRKNGALIYKYKDGRKTVIYQAAEIIDIPFMLKPDQLSHRGPITQCKDAIGLSIAARNYASRAFAAGAVPKLAMQGSFGGPESVKRASDDVIKAISKINAEGKNVLTMPPGFDLKPIAFNPQEMQLIESQRFAIEEIARVYSLPPVFLQDLTHGTFSNTEQQDLQFVKHTLKRWVEQFEQELTLKLFGRQLGQPKRFFVKLNVDGLLRGDFKTRMEGSARAIQSGLLTPNEARELENRPPLSGGDNLMIQGGTVPINVQLVQPAKPATGGKNA